MYSLLYYSFFLIKTALTVLAVIGITGIHTRRSIMLTNTIRRFRLKNIKTQEINTRINFS
jgi:hypothetical protein